MPAGNLSFQLPSLCSGNASGAVSYTHLGEPVFSFDLYLPDELTADAVRERFISEGDQIFRCMLGLLTGNRQMAMDAIRPAEEKE